MKYFSANFSLIVYTVAFTAQFWLCHALVRKEKSLEQNAEDALPKVTCSSRRMRAVFGPLVQDNLHVKDWSGAKVLVSEAKGQCGVRMGREKNGNLTFLSRYDSCYTQIEVRTVVISLVVQLTGEDRWFMVNISCPLIKTRSQKPIFSPTPPPGTCDSERALRVDCGPQDVSSDDCLELRCCYDSQDSNCYYRLNDCSLDGHFVFSVRTTDTEPPLTPSSLTVRDQPHCSPVITTADTAVFKIGVTECGAKMKIDGDFMIYEVEVEELHTNTVTENSPFSLQIQCEYKTSDLGRAADLRSLYVFTKPPPVTALGTVRVQMRIAEDALFTSFYHVDQLPVTFPLRKPVHVEVSIAQPSPDPTLSLRVRDCFAYPTSRHSVWTLLYDGCPNPLDNMRSSIPKDHQGKITSHSQVWRFDVTTFAFLDPQTGYPSVEEMYFYCWVEICTEDTECAQPCSIISSEGERQRRGAMSGSSQAQLVSLGPLLLDQNSTEVEATPCEQHRTISQVSLYMISTVCAALLFILLFMMWLRIRRQQKPEETCGTQPNIEQSQ